MANSADPDQPTDLDLHCLQRQGISGFSRTRVNNIGRDITFRKHTCSNILKILQHKKWKLSDKNSDIFHISAQKHRCGYSLD